MLSSVFNVASRRTAVFHVVPHVISWLSRGFVTCFSPLHRRAALHMVQEPTEQLRAARAQTVHLHLQGLAALLLRGEAARALPAASGGGQLPPPQSPQPPTLNSTRGKVNFGHGKTGVRLRFGPQSRMQCPLLRGFVDCGP